MENILDITNEMFIPRTWTVVRVGNKQRPVLCVVSPDQWHGPAELTEILEEAGG